MAKAGGKKKVFRKKEKKNVPNGIVHIAASFNNTMISITDLEGNLIALIRRCGDAIGEIQVADLPGRCEPGTGEINYTGIARTLVDLGYSGVVGLEAFAAADPDLALERFREAFTV